jgi:hypothetical protein
MEERLLMRETASFDLDGLNDLDGSNRSTGGVPTGAPSPTGRRTPNKVIDLSDEPDNGVSWQKYWDVPTTNQFPVQEIGPANFPNEDYDEDLQRALALSERDANGIPPQESGVVGAGETNFRPTNRTDYEYGKWDLVPTGKAITHDMVLDPEPEERKREEGVPVMLKPHPDDGRLSALLTVYHSIPLAREVLLDLQHTSKDYGEHPEWWKGEKIQVPEEPGNDDDYGFRDESLRAANEVRYELQRLMSFLDMSTRSYGSTESLINMKMFAQYPEPATKLMDIIKELRADDPSALPLFSRVVSSNTDMEQAINLTHDGWFGILPLNLPQPHESDIELETLYDIIDNSLWEPTEDNSLESTIFVQHVGEILAMQVSGDQKSRNIQVPMTWYADRYTFDRREAAFEMRLKKTEIREEIRRLDTIASKFTNFTFPGPGGLSVSVKNLLGASMKHNIRPRHDDNPPTNQDESMEDGFDSEIKLDLNGEISKLVAGIDKKLQSLEAQKEAAREKLRNLSKLYTESTPEQPLKHKLTLRGVSVTQDITYVRVRTKQDLMNMDIDSSPSTGSEQWWKLEWVHNSHSPISVTKAEEDEVVGAMDSSKQLVLVYASDQAVMHKSPVLPPALWSFVQRDNAIFARELGEVGDDGTSIQVGGTTTDRDGAAQDEHGPKSPGKRKYDSEEGEDTRESTVWSEGVRVAEREVSVSGGGDSEEEARDKAREEALAPWSGLKSVETVRTVEPVDGGWGQEMKERDGATRLVAGIASGSGPGIGSGISQGFGVMELEDDKDEDMDG